jgi:hypothetical protein
VVSEKTVPERWPTIRKWERALFAGRLICYDILKVSLVNAGVFLLLP